MQDLVQLLLNGLSTGAVYALFALGYTLVFSVLGVINFAHGAVFTLGAYFTYFLIGGGAGANGLLAGLQLPFALPFWLALPLAGLMAAAVALVIERIAFRPLRAQGADPLLALITSLGAGVVLVNLIQLLVGAESYAIPTGSLGNLPAAIQLLGAQVRTVQLLLLAVAAGLVVVLSIWIDGSRSGKALRAVSEDPITAQLLGIPSGRMIQIAFGLSGFLAGIAGGLVGLSVSIAGPYFGIGYGLKGLGVLVLGGLGSVPGAVLGGLIIGLAEACVPADLSGYRDVVAYGFLFVMLLVRPQGLLGKVLPTKV
ncbi:branched-chain amino acid ABC transporter permease [Cyanobium sp. HWJ4-Hawea]|uniref:branched-chain amino acid ABC transporter permease n=1 Tax=unclassified Cyanobium TaxID=2627006 RepID=UPI0020CC6177|nr:MULTISPECIES: branched-chain amino acid ABC transporter permease [unclassified Cyanobium]MCP9775025.1 branched-chain amino acid ABC transporter permease [Cyanobium sp. WAJ14-Wanaka]MCP9809647.1 branched-chain amino acid ABC transporter permease [Cyanobium sp. HWJ4-Hawea]